MASETMSRPEETVLGYRGAGREQERASDLHQPQVGARAVSDGDEARTFTNVTPGEARHAAVSFEVDHVAGRHVGGVVWLTDTLKEAFAFLADDVLGGDEPDGIYDLDTGEKTEIAVTVKVTRSSDSAITLNLLKEDRT
jgi:hypothetical protein